MKGRYLVVDYFPPFPPPHWLVSLQLPLCDQGLGLTGIGGLGGFRGASGGVSGGYGGLGGFRGFRVAGFRVKGVGGLVGF